MATKTLSVEVDSNNPLLAATKISLGLFDDLSKCFEGCSIAERSTFFGMLSTGAFRRGIEIFTDTESSKEVISEWMLKWAKILEGTIGEHELRVAFRAVIAVLAMGPEIDKLMSDGKDINPGLLPIQDILKLKKDMEAGQESSEKGDASAEEENKEEEKGS